jgi:hypothetical protein
MLTPSILNSHFFERERLSEEEVHVHQHLTGSDATTKIQSLLEQLLLFKNNNFLKKLSTFLYQSAERNFKYEIEEICLPRLTPYGTRNWNLDISDLISNSSLFSVDSFQNISNEELISERRIEEIDEEIDCSPCLVSQYPLENIEDRRLTKYKILIDPESEEKALYRRIEDTAGNNGDWVIGFGNDQFLFIGSWPVLIASNIIVFALGIYLRS